MRKMPQMLTITEEDRELEGYELSHFTCCYKVYEKKINENESEMLAVDMETGKPDFKYKA